MAIEPRKKLVSGSAVKKSARGERTQKLRIHVGESAQPKASKTRHLKVREEKDRKRTKIKILDKVVRSEVKEPPVIVQSKIKITKLAVRLPLPSEAVVGATARYAGIFFVAAGALFSLLNINAVTGTYASITPSSLTAQLYDTQMPPPPDGTYTSTSTSGTSGSNSGTGSGYTTSTVTLDHEPVPTIRVERPSPLSSMTPVNVTVPYASEVKLLVGNTESNQLTTVGQMFKIDDMNWRQYWDTTKIPNGSYKIKLIIKNQFGTYDHSDTVTYAVLNPVDASSGDGTTVSGTDDTDSTATTSSVTTTDTNTVQPNSTTTTRQTTPTVSLSVLEQNPVEGYVDLKVFVPDATSVYVMIKPKEIQALYAAGTGVFHSGDEWRIRWDSTKVPNGGYYLEANAMVHGVLYKSPLKSVFVENQTTDLYTQPTATSTATSTSFIATTTSPQPTVVLRLSKESPLSGFVDVYVETSQVLGVELYALPKSSLTPLFLGSAFKLSSTNWKYAWSTTQTPNGDYKLYARVKTEYGFTEGQRKDIRVLNEVITDFTELQATDIDTLSDANDSLIKTTDSTDDPESPDVELGIEPVEQPKVVYIQPVDNFVGTVDVEDTVRDEIEILLTDFRHKLDTKLSELARAERTGDTEALARVRKDIEDLKGEILLKLPGGLEQKEIIDKINTYISQITFELSELTIKNETILKERIGDAVLKDTDKDGISDYDEINIYQTNPFSADTDGDNYIDSEEIKQGFNPHDPAAEALVTYESPKETGIVREDLLIVDDIITLTPIEESSGAAPRAFITGKGLPNSYVTLYIYSEPIIVTVKTDEDGSWNYIFDKELSDGEHEVYIGITDNAGRLVAKSNPLPFVKTAEAYTGGSIASAPAEARAIPVLLGGNMLLLVGSIAILALGLVLILLGLHVKDRRPVVENTFLHA